MIFLRLSLSQIPSNSEPRSSLRQSSQTLTLWKRFQMATAGRTFDSTSILLRGNGKTSEELTPSSTAEPTQLRAIVWQLELDSSSRIELERFGIEVVGRAPGQTIEAQISAGLCDVLLVVAGHKQTGAMSDPEVRRGVAAGQAAGVGICLVVTQEAAVSSRELLAAGIDSLGFTDHSPALLAVAAFTAHKIAETRRSLKRQVSELEEKLERNRVIQQAKSILAEQMKITEGTALRHLRKEARDQRRTMWELAQVVNEAHRIFNSQSKSSRLSARKPDADLQSGSEFGNEALADPAGDES
jgi:AmiR/NasT family two-component response regulator